MRRRRRYYRGLSTVAVPPQIAPYFQRLSEDGIVVIPDFLPPETIDAMRGAVPDLADFEMSPEGDRSYFFLDAHKIQALSAFFDARTIRDLVRSYISDRAYPHRRTIGIKAVQGEFAASEMQYHMDTWRHRVKAFLYLEDVGPDQAPMTYLRGSHCGGWRRLVEMQIDRDYVVDDRGFGAHLDVWYLGCFWPHEVGQLKTDYGYEEVSCTGRAGTLVVFDGRGLHKATPLWSGRRLILTSYWIHEGGHV
jgi:Phytanoyl-CoA dioxygenase (PhyH)